MHGWVGSHAVSRVQTEGWGRWVKSWASKPQKAMTLYRMGGYQASKSDARSGKTSFFGGGIKVTNQPKEASDDIVRETGMGESLKKPAQ
jgi:hypothetical protein